MKQVIKIFRTSLNIFFIAAAIGLLLFEAHFLTRAQDDPVPAAVSAPDFSRDEATRCLAQFRPFFFEKKEEFGEFINVHFQSDLPTSQLIAAAVEKYRLFREESEKRIDEIIQSLVSKGGANVLAASRERSACEKVFSEESLILKDLLRQHILSNAYAKKTTRLLDRYKQINERLGKLNTTLAEMYGYFSSFSQRLPCYATKCVKS